MKIFKMAVVTAALVVSTSANAALIERLGGLAYYDDVADLTWLADANYAQTSGFDADGLMDWATANSWAAGLDVAGVTGWRLPDTGPGAVDPQSDRGSEMGNLFYNVLGGKPYTHIANSHNVNYDLFTNIPRGYAIPFWQGETYTYCCGTAAYRFHMESGGQDSAPIEQEINAWAVHSGDVSAVPVPAAVWLFGSGLVGLIGVARRKRHA